MRPTPCHTSRSRASVWVVAATLLALMLSAAAGCGGDSASSGTSSDYAGVWVDKHPFGEQDAGTQFWVRIVKTPEGYDLTWLLNEDHQPTQALLVQDDGSLRPAVAPGTQGKNAGPVAFSAIVRTGADTLEIRAPEGAWDDDPSDDRAVLVLRPGSKEGYARFLDAQAMDDDYTRALTDLQDAIDAWGEAHAWKPPAADDVKPGGAIEQWLRAQGKSWPALQDGTPLQPGTEPGQFVYEAKQHGFVLSGTTPSGRHGASATSDWSRVD